ncbi:GNAT family N-acetyltransferase [Paenibacillus solani]|uniref:GNAT family N-acetyltransferase n=1 Tax=Paenibacillus solani TaxID=1705565 RepID=UPI003D2BC3C3
MNKMIIHEVTHLITADLTEILNESTEKGFRNIQRLIHDYNEGINRFQLDNEALFDCRIDHRVIGVCGLNQDPFSNEDIGRIRRLYVLEGFRRQGVGKRLVEAVIHRARGHYSKLVLRTDNPRAGEFYKKLGFREMQNNERITHVLDL